ncbi:MAG TPA: acyl-CoA carboxylase subunit beta [Candidatus Marinimicrobia bacterium]|jgi:acetyl-CoA carboxylase carboxyltransferase component|nr:acyl-CoA carboxylase subunit beta [Candidatus Neomarinimicrobiota bacterium]
MKKWVGGQMDKIGTPIEKMNPDKFQSNSDDFLKYISFYIEEQKKIKLGGGTIAIEKQHNKKRLTARERIDHLIDSGTQFFELGIYAAWGMYEEYGSPPASGTLIGIGKIEGYDCVVVANDATVKAGAYFEVTLKKTLRAQQIALENNLPIIYLVDSAGVFLPLQDQVFPDEAHFGRIFYNNARLSALGIPQIAAVMGPCVAGGAYLPVMCDKYIIVEGASMFLAGPALVKAAIGQDIDADTLGGATTHSAISGTADFHEKDDLSGLERIRIIMSGLNISNSLAFQRKEFTPPQFSPNELIGLFHPENPGQYDVREIISRIVDDSDFSEFKMTYGKSLVCGTARIGGMNIGIVANQRKISRTEQGEMQMGGVIYSDSADKGARFIMNCNQDKIPLLFMHDVNGFMVGKDSEWGGIAKDGAKMVNAVSNSVVPKITLVIGGSYGAGNYALSGRAYSPRFMFAWPSAKIAVMGGDSAAKTLAQIKLAKMGDVDEKTKSDLITKIKKNYDVQSDPRYAAARMWIDEIIDPRETRNVIIRSLEIVAHQTKIPEPKFGVLQV